jgi:hypothetical protein
MLLIALSAITLQLFAQKSIRDKNITNQQERMVFKQWDKKKFTPTSGWLGINPEYWLTWGLHPNYPKTDLRPLGPYGPQTQRLALAAAMQSTANAYKLQADTLSNTALVELVNYSAAFSTVDPLWLLYYRKEFDPLLNNQQAYALNGVPFRERDYLLRTGAYDWFKEEADGLAERLDGAMNTTLDRGSRIIAYHRLLAEYRKLNASWEASKQYTSKFLDLKESADRIRQQPAPIIGNQGYRTDKQIADDILSRSKL